MKKLLFIICITCVPHFTFANTDSLSDRMEELQETGIENAGNPQILAAYNKLKETINKRENLQTEYLSALSDNADAMKENEQRIENKILGATGIAAIGIGGMQLASGLSEQNADQDAETAMRAYLSTFSCDYNDTQNFTGGETNITLPAINLIELKSEYLTLATSLKERKNALELPLGIESQEILDSATAGLYDDISTGKSDGAFTSLSAALMLPSGTDATEWAAEKEASSEKIKTGAIVAGVGAVASIAGNLILNKDAPKERSNEITREYEDNIANIDQEISEQQSELDNLITENENIIDDYNDKIEQHQDFVSTITEDDCIEKFRDYIDYINSLSLITNSYADTSSLEIPYDLENQRAAYQECVGEAQLNQQIQECNDTPNHEWVDGECVEQTTPTNNDTETQTENPEIEETTEEETTTSDPQQEQIDEESQIPDCPAAGNGLSTINETSVLGEPCTSSLITDGHIAKRKNDTCTCVAKDCIDGYEVVGGACKKIDSSKFCPANNPESPYLNDKNYEGQICENTDTHILQGKIIKISGGDNNGTCKCTPEICDNDYTVSNGICTEDIIETTVAQQNSAPKKEYKYYDCCNLRAVPSNKTSICKCDDTFSKNNVTASEGIGLAYELATKKYQNEIICDQKTRILGKHTYLRCTNKNDTEQYYEFPFKSLDNGNNGFTKALCNIWELKASSTQGCKDATSEQCTEISTAINRTFYTNGAAEYDTNTNFCKIKPHQNATNNKTKWDAFVGQVITSDEINMLPNIDPLYFYDISVSSNSDLYNNINNYMFNTLKLPVHEFKCGMGFIDNQQFFSGTRAEYNEIQNKIRQCISDSTTYGAQMSAGITTTCNKQNPTNTIYTDIITCEYNGQQIDFLFKKLDTKWNRKALGGMQGLLCLSKGGDFSGKDVCALPDEATCTLLDNEFKQKYPDSLGLKWEDGVCVLKDAKRAKNLEKTATVAGIVAVTLVTAGNGGPIMLTLTIVESTALVTEAVTETKISKWADSFITDAYNCSNSPKHKQSGCADTVLKKHTARITAGEKTFSQGQQSSISKNMEKLIGMLDTKTLEKIIQTAEESKIITEQLDDNDLEEILNSTSDSDNTITEDEWSKIINKYYNKGLSNDDKALIVTNKIATVATFATLFAGGIMAGMRQAVKKGWITISKDTARKWAKLRILSPKDYRAYCKKFNIVNKTDDVVKNITMTYPQAKRLDEIDKSLAKVDDALSKHPTAELRKQKTKLTQERNELLNKIGTKDDAALAVAKSDAYRAHDIDLAHQEYDNLLKKRNEWDNYMKNHNGNPPQNVGKKEIESLNNQIAQAEKKLTDLGESVQPAKKLELPTVAPKAQPTAPDFNKLAKQADRNFNRRLNDFKNGKPQNLPKKNLNDDQWKQLSDHLEETEGIRIVETNKNGTTFMSFEKVDNAASITNKSDDIVSQVDNVANKTQKVPVSNTDDVAKTTNQVDNIVTHVDDTAEAFQAESAIEGIRNRASRNFTSQMGNFKAGKSNPAISKSQLNDAEWKQLNTYLEEYEGVRLVEKTQNGKKVMMFEKVGNKVDNVEDAAKTADNVTDAGKTVSKTATAAPKSGASDIADLQNRASTSFSTYVTNVKQKDKVVNFPKDRLNDAEWKQLSKYMEENEGIIIRENPFDKNSMQMLQNTSKKTATSTRNVTKGAASTASKSAGNLDDVVAISAKQANASNVATLRQSASNNFDKYLADVKTNSTGKGEKLPKNHLNDAGWNEVNKSLAGDNVQLVDTGDGYMQFVRADHIDDEVEVVAKVVPDVFDARKMRVSDGSGKLYVRNSASEMLGYPVNGNDAVNDVGQLYETIRRGIEYPVDNTKVSRAINAMEKPNNNAILYRAPINTPTYNYDWHVHSYNGPRGSSAEVRYHVSLNVEVDDTLIKKLDDIIARDQGQHIVNFKIPPVGRRWETMADPISIYMRGTNPEIERAIAEAAKPYVRTSSEIGLLGRKIDNGVAIAYETSAARVDIVDDIINQVAKKDAGVAAKLREKGGYSVGYTEALRLWASDFLGYTIAPVIP